MPSGWSLVVYASRPGWSAAMAAPSAATGQGNARAPTAKMTGAASEAIAAWTTANTMGWWPATKYTLAARNEYRLPSPKATAVLPKWLMT